MDTTSFCSECGYDFPCACRPEAEPVTHCVECGVKLRPQDIKAEYDTCVECDNAAYALKRATIAVLPCGTIGCANLRGADSPDGLRCRSCWDAQMDALSLDFRQKQGLLEPVLNG